MKKIDWGNVQEAENYQRLAPGGYIAMITDVADNPDKEYLMVEYDVWEGEYSGYFAKLNESLGFWGGKFVKSYKEKAQPFFKAFLTAVKKSNEGFMFNSDENTLLNKMIGVVLGEEEYLGKDGTTKKRLYVAEVRSVDAIRSGDYSVPALKALAPDAGFTPVETDKTCPF